MDVLTIEELEATLGEQVRRSRIAQDLGQAELAQLADVSIRALGNLERGRGSSVATLIALVRALGRTTWLEDLAPAAQVSPMQMLRTSRRTPERTRVRHPRTQGRPR